MQKERIIILQFRLTRRNALLLLSAFFLCWHPRFLGSEQLTLTTYYPAPYGGYVSMLTTGQTLMARDTGVVGIGTSSPSPTTKLHVNAPTGGEVARFSAGASGDSFIRVDAGSSQGRFYTVRNGDSSAGTSTNTDFYLQTAGNNRVRISPGGSVGVGSQLSPWSPIELMHVKDGNSRIENGNLILAGDSNTTGFIEGICTVVPYGINVTVPCPNGKRVMAVYGQPCNAGGTLFLGGNLEDPGRWVPHVENNCTGDMLCCNIKSL